MFRLTGKIKWFIWRLISTPYYRIKYHFNGCRNQFHILNSTDTILYIIKNGCSVSRFGDGEFQMITHMKEHGTEADFYLDTFQHYDARLASRLLEVYKSNLSNHLVCIPYAFKDSSVYKGSGRFYFERELLWRRDLFVENSDVRLMGDACFTRFYMSRRDIKDYSAYIDLLKRIWDSKKILIAEGERSRLGVGNDLFDNAAEIHRLLCPVTNAFDRYNQIISEIKKMSQDVLILLALGHTATVLAYDLAQCGYQAIDIGHVDIEYEWMLKKSTSKEKIGNKYMGEIGEVNVEEDLDTKYREQIIFQIFA